jgi:hypothetical protein
MIKIIATLFFFFSILTLSAQYKLEKDVDGVQFFSKWGREVWYKPKSPKVLLIKVVNSNEEAVRFDLGIEFTENLQMVQQGLPAEYCLGAKKKLLPRINGIMYKYEMGKVSGGEAEYELTGLVVTKVPLCDED